MIRTILNKKRGADSAPHLCYNRLSLLSHSCKALAAINRAVRLRLKRNSGFPTASGAYCCKELARTTGGILAGIAAGLAALRLVLEPTLCIELLLTGGEHELIAAFLAHKGLVFVHF
mgnify:CR=1 FL=1